MMVSQSGSVSILALVGLYWLAVLAAYVVRGRLQVRRAQPGADGRVRVAGELTFVRLTTVLLGVPVAFILLLWLLTIL